MQALALVAHTLPLLLQGAVFTMKFAVASTFQPLPLYLAAAAIYWVLSTLLARVQVRIEKRCAMPSH